MSQSTASLRRAEEEPKALSCPPHHFWDPSGQQLGTLSVALHPWACHIVTQYKPSQLSPHNTNGFGWSDRLSYLWLFLCLSRPIKNVYKGAVRGWRWGGAEEKESNFVWKQFQSLISKEGGGKGGWTGGVLFCQGSSKGRECILLVCCRMKNEKFDSTWILRSRWAAEVRSELYTHTHSKNLHRKKINFPFCPQGDRSQLCIGDLHGFIFITLAVATFSSDSQRSRKMMASKKAATFQTLQLCLATIATFHCQMQ